MTATSGEAFTNSKIWLTTVVSPEGEAIGNIEEILIDEDAGCISGVVLSVGGVLGFGSKSIAVDWIRSSLHWKTPGIRPDKSG